jgi:hypothetical protein
MEPSFPPPHVRSLQSISLPQAPSLASPMPSVSNAQTSIADVALLRSNQLPFLLLYPADAPPSIFLSAATLPWLCPCFLSELAPAPTSDVSSPSRPAPPPPWFPPYSDQVCQVRPFCSPCPPHASTRAPPPVPAPLHRRPGRCRAPSPSRWRGQASRYSSFSDLLCSVPSSTPMFAQVTSVSCFALFVSHLAPVLNY